MVVIPKMRIKRYKPTAAYSFNIPEIQVC